jgi:hypothetical protein
LPPRKIDPRIPRDLETVVLKCLAKGPGQRYATAEALAEDLERFLVDRPIRARRATVVEQGWRWCRRNPLAATLIGVVLLLVLGTAVGGMVMSLRLNDALGRAQADRDRALEAEQERKKQLFESLVSQAKAQGFSGRLGQRFGTLESIKKAATLAHELEMPPATFDELRNLAIAALALPDIHLLKEREVAASSSMAHSSGTRGSITRATSLFAGWPTMPRSPAGPARDQASRWGASKRMVERCSCSTPPINRGSAGASRPASRSRWASNRPSRARTSGQPSRRTRSCWSRSI